MTTRNMLTPQKTSAPSTLRHSTTWEPHFLFQGRTLVYNRISFNNRAERAVEIPLAIDFLARQQQRNERFLEVGNVLQHYEAALGELPWLRRIIDKFEQGKGVENRDLMDLDPAEKYRLIISISTVEHIGQHSTPNGSFGEIAGGDDREAPLKAIVKIYDLLESGGHAFVTVPFGKLIAGGWYIQFSAEYLDLLVTRYGLPREALTVTFLKRVERERALFNPRQRWIEVTADDAREIRYDTFWSGARAIAVLELAKLAQPVIPNSALPTPALTYEYPSRFSRFCMRLGSLKRSIFNSR